MKIKIISGMVMMAVASLAQAQSNVNNNFETSASIESFCKIETQDINFGIVNLPLTAQSANAQMNVLCSNETRYEINLAYGGKYGSGLEKNVYTTEMYGGFSAYETTWRIFNNGKVLGNITCRTGGTPIFTSSNQEVKDLYSFNGSSSPVRNICSGVSLNQTTLTSLNSSVSYDYGVMNGVVNGDLLAYKITIPNDTSKVWNNGINSYKEIGDGQEKIININAILYPEKSSSYYVGEDNYIDTVVATISY